MASITLKDQTGGDAGTVELDDKVFGVQPNVPLMHQVVTAQLAAARSGTQSTKTRAEVRGGGAKPWKQKGTGRARQGSTRAPQWSGGGVALGPKPRSYEQKTPKKMIRLALLGALSDRASEGNVIVIDRWDLDVPSTRAAKAALAGLGLVGKKVLVVCGPDDVKVALSFRNLDDCHPILFSELNAYDVLVSDVVLFTRDTLPGTTTPVVETPVALSAPAAETTTEAE
ncbi:MAG: large subunit ribosomal protein [Actinomycetota bacterium]|nr:large subunit ribosomal protein [Actinomycetota bacterium]